MLVRVQVRVVQLIQKTRAVQSQSQSQSQTRVRLTGTIHVDQQETNICSSH
jgi:hypothetical protein